MLRLPDYFGCCYTNGICIRPIINGEIRNNYETKNAMLSGQPVLASIGGQPAASFGGHGDDFLQWQ
jgi:hypothetical protein